MRRAQRVTLISRQEWRWEPLPRYQSLHHQSFECGDQTKMMLEMDEKLQRWCYEALQSFYNAAAVLLPFVLLYAVSAERRN